MTNPPTSLLSCCSPWLLPASVLGVLAIVVVACGERAQGDRVAADPSIPQGTVVGGIPASQERQPQVYQPSTAADEQVDFGGTPMPASYVQRLTQESCMVQEQDQQLGMVVAHVTTCEERMQAHQVLLQARLVQVQEEMLLLQERRLQLTENLLAAQEGRAASADAQQRRQVSLLESSTQQELQRIDARLSALLAALPHPTPREQEDWRAWLERWQQAVVQGDGGAALAAFEALEQRVPLADQSMLGDALGVIVQVKNTIVSR